MFASDINKIDPEFHAVDAQDTEAEIFKKLKAMFMDGPDLNHILAAPAELQELAVPFLAEARREKTTTTPLATLFPITQCLQRESIGQVKDKLPPAFVQDPQPQ